MGVRVPNAAVEPSEGRLSDDRQSAAHSSQTQQTTIAARETAPTSNMTGTDCKVFVTNDRSNKVLRSIGPLLVKPFPTNRLAMGPTIHPRGSKVTSENGHRPGFGEWDNPAVNTRTFLALPLVAAAAASGLAARSRADPPLVSNPASYVDTRIGTANGGNTFPGAVLPFGMLAWSPEQIRPDPQRAPDGMRAAAAGGYQYDSTRMRGFSLTHLSGTGCRGASGDVPFMPITTSVTTAPSADAKNAIYGADFDHANETGAAGSYQATLASGVNVELTAAPRSGIGRFTYPQAQPATMLVRTSDSQVGSSEAHVDVDRTARTVSGSVTSGNFCGYIGTVNRHSYYTLHFVAVFDRPFASVGTWKNDAVTAGATTADGGTTYGTNGYPAPGLGSGAYVTFDPGSVVNVRVGISYVSLDNARANLDAEMPAASSFDAMATRARDAWNLWLRRIEIAGGTEAERRIFYTALYHASMHLNLSSDVNGEYAGFDGRTHAVAAPQRAQYANFSGWDVYRSQLMLVTLLDPAIAGDMAQSLLNQANQNHGEWDRWTHNTGATHVMEGDAAAQSVPSIVAFGGTDFDMKAAFDSLYRAATVPTANDLSREGCNVACPGERPSLDKWLTIHYIPTQSNAWGGAGETLEDVTADFALSEFARRLNRTKEADELRARSGYWRNIFNPEATPDRGYIQNRNEDGTWPRFNPSSSNGFAEGSSAVYTWMIPFDVKGLFEAMGGVEAATTRLDDFFHRPDGTLAVTGAGGLHAEMNNEPSIGAPWLYSFAGRAERTQQIIRETIKVLWKDTPPGIPGNDDLGAMSAWFVWAAMGMHPLAPGRAELVLASPLFPRIVVHRGSGQTITVRAAGAKLDTFYVQSLRVNGQDSSRAWLPESFVTDGGTLDYTLGSTPNPRWASAPGDLPPSFGPGPGR
jgi:predicted alpha-1,2-mannosidase